MDPLKPSSRLAASLQALRLARAGTPSGTRRAEAGDTAAADAPATLGERLLELVAGVDIHDPDAVRRARKPVVSAILLDEFGDAARADPRFDEMVAAVDAALSAREDGTDPFLDLLHAMKGRNHP